MDTTLTVIADVIILVTFPLHCRYIYVMLHNEAKIASLEYAFRITLTNLVFANLLYCIIFILIQEPASYGAFLNFYKNNSWWLGRVVVMQSIPLTLVTTYFHVLIATNRLSALVCPTRHGRLWTERFVMRLLFALWALTIALCIPLIYPIEGVTMVAAGLLNVLAFLLYACIGFRMSRIKNLPRSTITATLSAILVSSGGFFIIILVIPDMLSARLTGKRLWSEQLFYALFKLSNAFSNAVAPWAMLFCYPYIRRLLMCNRKLNAPTESIVDLNKTKSRNIVNIKT